MVDDGTAKARAAAEWARAHMDAYEQRLRALVAIDSGADCPQGREQVAALLCEWAEEAGCTAEVVPLEAGGHVVASLPGEGEGRIVLLGHHDTVYPAGTAAARPMTVSAGRARGPGVADMKGGLLVGLLAMESLAQGPRAFARVELHSVPDEEVRTHGFGTLDRVLGADAVLVLECGRENGDLVSGRKVGAWLRLVVEGVSAHAGTEPELGRSAVLGLCREILRCSALNDARPGLTVVAGTVQGGTIANVVAGGGRGDAGRALAAPRRFRLGARRARALRRPRRLAGAARGRRRVARHRAGPRGAPALRAGTAIAASLGESVGGQTSGGMSDGCWTAAAGIPTLDGFGPVGGRDHSPEEYALLDSIPLRSGLLAGLCDAIGSGLLSAGQRGRVKGRQEHR